jgi:hypothetical protein
MEERQMSTLATNDVITDRAALEEHFGEPVHVAVAVEKTSLDEFHKFFIAHSPFMCFASAGVDVVEEYEQNLY